MQQYDPKNVVMTFGPALIDGYAPDSFISIERNADSFALLIGSDGEAARSASNNKSARITVRLMPGSVGNAVLKAALMADEAGGAGVLPLTITDSSVTPPRVHAAESAWVVRDPDIDYQTEAQPIEYILETDRMISTTGIAP